MEQDVFNEYKTVCTACLSSDRNLISINGINQLYEVFRLLMYDFAGDRFGDSVSEMEQFMCWECLALLKKFSKFKQQVHRAQEHLRVLTICHTQDNLDNTYITQSLSSLDKASKINYDKIFFDYGKHETKDEWPVPIQFITVTSGRKLNGEEESYDVGQAVPDGVNLAIGEHILGVPTLEVGGDMTGIMSHIVVDADDLVSTDNFSSVKGELSELTTGSLSQVHSVIMSVDQKADDTDKEETSQGQGYVTEYMTEPDMLAAREEAKLKVQYVSSIYKCELCIMWFYTQQQVETHFMNMHTNKPGLTACKVCYVYMPVNKLQHHMDRHYIRHVCKLCGHREYGGGQLMKHHMQSHLTKKPPPSVVKIGDAGIIPKRGRIPKREQKLTAKTSPKPGDLRKLLSKTTIEGYQCLECDMFFKSSRARKNHVARYHREGLQCDHCKKRFVNRTTLATHLRLHEGPLPREECPICHKMVRVIQLKYHIQRHQSKSRYECTDCKKVFSHLATYQAHLKYSRAHASDQIFKFPCPMCNKGYPTKETMQDHFNYQHLGKTTHKCPVCNKPIASRANVEKHMMRVHGEKKEKPRNHVCDNCGKSFTDKKALTQHEVIHSTERPLSCDICQQTFRQKASLYTHRKRVHKMFPAKRVLEYMDVKPEAQSRS